MRILSLCRFALCFSILGLVAPGVVVAQALLVGHDFWRYTGTQRTIHYLSLRFWPTWILLLGSTQEPMFSLKALVVIGVAIIANVAFYGIVGCAVWGTFAGLGALLKLWTNR